MTECCDLTASEARRLIGTREISARELVESCIARVEDVNPAVNAMVATSFDRARQEAEQADRDAAAGTALGLLHGLPFGVKDLTDTAGVRTTYGSKIYADHVPTADARIVADIRAAGGIMLGKTNTPEWGAGANTFNPVYGATGNPFDPTLVSGGSSGGSAVALATGMVPLAPGSDMGGSLRTPAAYCGVVGFRPSPGLVPNEKRPRLWVPFSVDGPMARTVEDVALLLSVIARHDPQDPFSRPSRPNFSRLSHVDLATLRVGLSDDLGFTQLDRRIRDTFRHRAGALAPAFKSCSDADVALTNAHEVFDVLRGFGFAASYGQMLEKHPDKVGDLVADNTRYGLSLTAAQVAAAEIEHAKMYRRFQALFDDIDVLICPTVALPPFPKEQPYPTEIEGEKVRSYIHWIAPTYGLTLMSNPVVCLPCGLDPT